MKGLPSLGAGEWLAIVLVVAGVGFALWSGPNLDIGLPSAAVAVAGGILLAALGLETRRRAVTVALETPESDPMVGLAGAFREGVLGRAEIVAHLRGLSRELHHVEIGPTSLEQEVRLLSSSPEAFREWVDRHVTRLERET